MLKTAPKKVTELLGTQKRLFKFINTQIRKKNTVTILTHNSYVNSISETLHLFASDISVFNFFKDGARFIAVDQDSEFPSESVTSKTYERIQEFPRKSQC